MAIKHPTNLIICSLLLFLLLPSNAEEQELMAVVEGMVYCQSCKYFGTTCLSEATPISAARVSIACKDHKNRVCFYKVYTTDPNGYFYAQLRNNPNPNPGNIKSCSVYLLSSPNPNCNLLSNINSGIDGSPLSHTHKSLPSTKDHKKNIEVYAAGPLAFRPSHCLPATHY